MTIKNLPRLTVCTKFDLQTPIWGGKKPHVGLKQDRITEHNEITVAYVRKSDGQKTFPETYYFDGTKLNELDYEVQNVKGITLVLVPFSHLEILNRVDKVPEQGSLDELMDWAGDKRYAKSKEQLDEQ